MAWATLAGGFRLLPLFVSIALFAVACGGDGGSPNQADSGDTEESSSPTPEEEELDVTEARVEGTWRHVRTNTKVTNKTSTKHPSLTVGFKAKFIYKVRPECSEGPCGATVKYDHLGSDSKGTFDLAFRQDRYVSRTVGKGGSCAGVEPAWKAVTTVVWIPIKAEDRDGDWVATAYDGTYKQVQTPVNETVRDAGCGPATILGEVAGKRTD